MSKILRLIPLIFIIPLYIPVLSQDMNYVKEVVRTLSSEEFYGRGYTNKGDSIASEYLRKEFDNIGLAKFEDSYFQKYTISVNTIIEDPVLKFGDKELRPAKDFVVIPNSPSMDEWVKICWINKHTLTNYWGFNHFYKSDKEDCFICIDSSELDNPDLYKFANLVFSRNFVESKGILEASDRLKYTARTYVSEYTHIQIKPEAIDFSADSVYIKIVNEFHEEYFTQNIVGLIPGKTDSIIMITAHYDHLGMMGDKMFPGANDNASGVSMVLSLAKHYKKQKKGVKHNLVFVLFSGEEAGLLGSRYFAENPYFDLSLVKAVINFDMVGTGEEGLAVFNAKEYPDCDTILTQINRNLELFDIFRTTNAVSSSDHAPFHDKGVKAMFFYLSGNNQNYHQPEDVYEDVSFYGYRQLYRLITEFVENL
jgi:aminopeptidase YwaD